MKTFTRHYNLCVKTFTRHYNLHVETCTRSCNLCVKTFTRHYNLHVETFTRHCITCMRRHSQDTITYVCVETFTRVAESSPVVTNTYTAICKQSSDPPLQRIYSEKREINQASPSVILSRTCREYIWRPGHTRRPH